MKKTLKQIERDAVVAALNECTTRRDAANRLGISIRTLFNKLRKYNDEDDFKPVPKVSKKQSVSMQEREEIQEVPSADDAENDPV